MTRPYPSLYSRKDRDVSARGEGNPGSTSTIETASRGPENWALGFQAEKPYRRLLLSPIFSVLWG